MKGTEKLHEDKCKEIMNDWNDDVCCTLTSLPVSGLINFTCLIFVSQTVHATKKSEPKCCFHQECNMWELYSVKTA
jgi:hypothetical protein